MFIKMPEMSHISKIYRICIYTFAVIVAGAVTVACQKEEQLPQGGFPVKICTTVQTANQLTKTSVNDDLSINWTSGDRLLMLAQTSSGAAASSTLDLKEEDAGAKTATFTGIVETAQVPASCYFAYPANTNTTLNASAGTVSFNYASQDGTHNPFLASPAIAYNSSGIECTLAHIGGVLEVALPSQVESFVIQGNNGEKLSGYTYNFNTSSGTIDENALGQITVTPSGTNGICYVNMPPVKFEKGFTIIFNGADGKKMYKSFNYTSGGCDFSQAPATGESATYTTLKGALVPVDAKEFSEFSPVLASTAQGSHIYSSDVLTGSQVKISAISLSGVPSSVITGYSATLTNSAGTVVRSYNSSAIPSELTLGSDNNSNWPYLPKGTYTLVQTISTIYGTTTNFENASVELPAPVLKATIDAKTSYSYYLSGDVATANSLSGSSIYNITVGCNISQNILQNANYTATAYAVDHTSSDASVNAQLKSASQNLLAEYAVSQWKEYNLGGYIIFDGVQSDEAAISVHVTGLPYSANPPKNSGDHPWRILTQGTRTYINFESSFVHLETDGTNPSIASSAFHIPQNINIAIYSKYRKNTGSIGKYTYSVNLLNNSSEGSSIISHSSNSKGTYELNGNGTFTTTYNALSCKYSYKALGNNVDVFTVNVSYR